MKKFSIILISLGCSFLAFSQELPARSAKIQNDTARNYFYLSPFNLILSQFLISYERDINEKHGIAFFPGVILDRNQYYSGVSFGVSAEMQYRHNIIRVTNPRGKARNQFRLNFYFAPFAAYQYLDYLDWIDGYYASNGTWVEIYDTLQIHGVSGGILFGTKFTFFERFSLDAYTGGGIKYSNKEAYYSDIFREGYTGVIGKVNLQFGVAF